MRFRLFIAVTALAIFGASCADDSLPLDTIATTSSTTTATSTPVVTTTTVVAVSPVPSTTVAPSSPAGPTACSASGMSRDLPVQLGLPEAVARTRQAIVDAAVTCNWTALAELLRPAGDTFVYSFGGGGNPVGAFMEYERGGFGRLRIMVILLKTNHRLLPASGSHPETYGWPDAFGGRLTDAEVAPLRDLYPPDVIDRMRSPTGPGYIGWRTGIDVNGTWWYMVEGD